MRKLIPFILLFAAACQQVSPDRPPMSRADVAEGRELAQKHCSSCHAIGKAGPSVHPEAPPFRELAQSYPPDALAESLIEGIMTGHPDMPVFVFGEKETDALVAYLNSIQDPAEI